MNKIKFLLALCLAAFFSHCEANDGVMDISVGGLTLAKETNVSMNSEVLEISKSKISVKY